MATYEGIEQELKDAKAEYGKAGAELKQWKEMENGGMWLEDLRGKVRRKEQLDEDDKRQLERLEEKEKRLESSKERWEKKVSEWDEILQKRLGEEKGNEQIA